MKVLFFDGHCTLCNRLVDCLIKIDKRGVLKFASLQGEQAQKMLGVSSFALKPTPETVVYLRDQKQYQRSAAILMALSDLGKFWSLAKIFFIIPEFLRDFFYQLIAKNRYRLFGRKQTCRVPTLKDRDRFLL